MADDSPKNRCEIRGDSRAAWCVLLSPTEPMPATSLCYVATIPKTSHQLVFVVGVYGHYLSTLPKQATPKIPTPNVPMNHLSADIRVQGGIKPMRYRYIRAL